MRDPVRFIAARTLQGGPAAPVSLRQAALFAKFLRRDQDTVAGMEQHLAKAAADLERAVDAVIVRAKADPSSI